MDYNPHICPPYNELGHLPIEYMTLVMTEASKGKQVEARSRLYSSSNWGIVQNNNCAWNWNGWSFRIKEPDSGMQLLAEANSKGWVKGNVIFKDSKITSVSFWAPGHPLPETSISVKEHARVATKPFVIVCYEPHFASPLYALNHLTPRPPHVPQPVKIMPMLPGDYPAFFWLRKRGDSDILFPSTLLSNGSVFVKYYGDVSVASLMADFEYSSDRKTWLPCHKEVPL